MLVAVAVGGAIGAVCRYILSSLLTAVMSDYLAIMFVNVLGCLVMGLVTGLWYEVWLQYQLWKAMIVVGFLGSFTTFSAFSLENYFLLKNGAWPLAVLNSLLSVMCCLLAVIVGIAIARLLRGIG